MDRTASLNDEPTIPEELKQLHQYFMTQHSSESLFVDPTFEEHLEQSALDQLQHFITKPDATSLLLTGEPGSGKSTLLKQLTHSHWNNWFDEKGVLFEDLDKKTRWVPIYIPLTSINPKKLHRRLLQSFFDNLEIVEKRRITQNSSLRLLVLLDGFDEISGQEQRNLVINNQWLKTLAQAKQLKVIISCRTDLLQSNERWHNWFKIPNELLQQVHLLPFNDKQIERYVKRHLASSQVTQPASSSIEVDRLAVPSSESPVQDDWSQVETYLEHLRSFPGLFTLVGNPFILKMVVDSLPIIITELKRQPNDQALTRKKIYQTFIDGYFTHGAQRIYKKNSQLTVEEWKLCLWCYTHRLAVPCFQQDFLLGTVISAESETLNTRLVEPSDEFQHDEVLQGYSAIYEKHKQLLSDESTQQWLRAESLLKIKEIDGEKQFQFLHRTLVEFFAASKFFQDFLSIEQGLKQAIRRSSADSRDEVSDETPVDDEMKSLPEEQPNDPLASAQAMQSFLTHPLSQDNQITLYLIDAAQDPKFCEKLMNIVKHSADSVQGPDCAISAANAMTILCAVKTSFAHEDLTGIRIPGADCRGGLFFNATLARADLRAVNFERACLDQANMQEALVDGIKLGQRPQIQTKLPIAQLQMNAHPNFPGWLAVSWNSEKLYIQPISQDDTSKASKPTKIKLKSRWGKVLNVALNSQGTRIAISFKDGSIRHFSLVLTERRITKETSLNLNTPSNDSPSSTSAVDAKMSDTHCFATHLSFAPDDGTPPRLAMGITTEYQTKEDEHSIGVWEWRSGKHCSQWYRITTWHEKNVFSLFTRSGEDEPHQLVWSNSGDLLAVSSINRNNTDEGSITVRPVPKKSATPLPQTETRLPCNELPTSLAFSKDNESLFIAINTLFARSKIISYEPKKINLFNYLDNPEFTSALESNQVYQLALSPNKKWLALIVSGWRNNTVILIWDLIEEKIAKRLPLGIRFDPNYPLAFSPDSSTLAVATGQTIEQWEIEAPTSSLSSQSEERILWQDFSVDGNSLVTQRGRKLSFHCVNDHHVQFEMPIIYLPNMLIYRMMVPGGGLFVIGIILNTPPEKPEIIVKFSPIPAPPVTPIIATEFAPFLQGKLTEHEVTHISASAFSSDGTMLMLAAENKVFLYQTKTFSEAVLQEFDQPIRNIIFTPSNDHVALFDMADKVHLYPLSNPSNNSVALADKIDFPEIKKDGDEQGTVYRSMTFSSANLLAIVRVTVPDNQCRVDLYDSNTYINLGQFANLNNQIHHLSFSPNGQMLALCTHSNQATVQFWKITYQQNNQIMIEKSQPCPIPSPTQLYWKDDNHLLIATGSGGVQHYQPLADNDTDWQCTQISFHDHLSANSLLLTGCIGLDDQNHQLLRERGAVGDPSATPPARIRETKTRENLPHLEYAKAINDPNLQPSVISGLSIDYENWVVHLCRYGKSEHVFLLLEGLDAYGRSFFLRYELVTQQDQPNLAHIHRKDNIPGLTYYTSDITPVSRKALLSKFIKTDADDLCLLSWPLARKRGLQLINIIEQDMMNGPFRYALRGQQASGVKLFKGPEAHNCFTWAREKLFAIEEDKSGPIHTHLKTKAADIICAIPSWYVPSIQESSSGCLIL